MFQKKSQTGRKTRIILSSKSLPNYKRPLLNCALRVTGLHKQAFTAKERKNISLHSMPKNTLRVSPLLRNPYLRAGLKNKTTAWEIKTGKGRRYRSAPSQEKDKGQLHGQGKQGG
ncbi:hypothetical protein CEXT_568451 [Caerostris extrusa]|uniref:Uncharacterized protein n=1 Tax=Caerostris extrusa TaxID=172846 RepID=A0AAV4YC82_CAEEX|nr:hypothetical protein CEXT_568451 [Caerostris extrusa]